MINLALTVLGEDVTAGYRVSDTQAFSNCCARLVNLQVS